MEAHIETGKVGIVGSGLIGQSWAMLFAAAGYQVKIYDEDPSRMTQALEEIKIQLQDLDKRGLLRGELTVDEQFSHISTNETLEECIKDTFYIQESVPEEVELKKKVHTELDKFIGSNTILASSTSAILPSIISEALVHRNRFIVVHPTNPPFYVPMVELCPAPWTDPEVLETTRALMKDIGQKPVTINKEIDGFVLNRIQSAILGEGWRLVRDNVISVEDFDIVMKHGLGRRYAFMGPFETTYLNAEGWKSLSERYADTFYRVEKTFGEPEKMVGPTVDKIQNECNKMIPIEKLQERRQWRDRRLTALAKLIKDMEEEEEDKQAEILCYNFSK
ncbi:hypothetical protein CHS0354_012986 [Potamilus streckersoni]|uniref:L-gulonate 3-dehydrogenase n=1 Tax=Potamilus streckersoni TaxID=2493646 RepID=A0AAE0T7B6_9BIVA|nr:hypothetical protein CHS0354_012986 [Potamilus streckersoni]